MGSLPVKRVPGHCMLIGNSAPRYGDSISQAAGLVHAGEELSRNKKMPRQKSWHFVERLTGVEPAYAAWEAAVLPMNYSRIGWKLELIIADRACKSNTKKGEAEAAPPQGKEKLLQKQLFIGR